MPVNETAMLFQLQIARLKAGEHNVDTQKCFEIVGEGGLYQGLVWSRRDHLTLQDIYTQVLRLDLESQLEVRCTTGVHALSLDVCLTFGVIYVS